MESDLLFMEHTEKIVADVLKYVFVPNNEEYKKEVEVEETLEYVLIEDDTDETKDSPENLVATNISLENRERLYNIDVDQNKETIKFGEEPALGGNYNDIESLIAEGLQRIRLDYPIYAGYSDSSTDSNLQENCQSLPVLCVSSNYENSGNTHYNNDWYINPMNPHEHVGDACPNVYQDEINRAIYGDQQCCDIDPSTVHRSEQSSQYNKLKNIATNRVEVTEVSSIQQQCNDKHIGDDSAITNTLNLNSNKDLNQELPKSTSEKSTVNKSGIAVAASKFRNYRNEIESSVLPSSYKATSTATTMTSTSTSNAFGILHQQTSSSTTINYVSNNLANAALTNSSAVMYAQSLLAQQYLNAILKESQQYSFTGYNTNNMPNINVGIYERLLYAQLLQQQICQHQQKLSMQGHLNNASIATNSNVAAAATDTAVSLVGGNVSNSLLSLNDCESQGGVSLKHSLLSLTDMSSALGKECLDSIEE